MADSQSLLRAFLAADEAGTGFVPHGKLVGFLQKAMPGLPDSEIEEIVASSGTSKGMIDYKAFMAWLGQPVDADEREGMLFADTEALLAAQKATYLKRSRVCNDSPIEEPDTPTFVENTLLFLPERAVHDLKLEPNIGDKGEEKKSMWFGRVWQLKALLEYRQTQKLRNIRMRQANLSEDARADLDKKMQDPEKRAIFTKVVAHWKGASLRNRLNLSVLEKLKYSNIWATMVYAHGSGGCSWDNMRICRMICQMGVMVIAPDGFAHPKDSAMGHLRHKDVLPLHRAEDDMDYWGGDLIYASPASGEATYSTKADCVLADPSQYRELYERCYQLRRAELHFIIDRLPVHIKTRGFFLGGTSEGGMTIARFDDQRYGNQVLGRFINSFSIEYCYFTPVPEAAQIGGQLHVPTLNIIGTKDQYFGPEDSVAKIVASDPVSGYGNAQLTGNGYETLVRQGVSTGLVCVLENGVHSPCNTHDNFLRQLFELFFLRPTSIPQIAAIWANDPTRRNLLVEQDSTEHPNKITKVFVPTMKYCQMLTLREAETKRAAGTKKKLSDELKAKLAEQQSLNEAFEEQVVEEHEIHKEMLDDLRAKSSTAGGTGFACTNIKENYWTNH